MNNHRILLLAFILGLIFARVEGQEDLMNMLEEETGEQTDYTSATFKATRIMNGHSIERMPQGQLDVRIHHRFGRINSGAYELWGLDQANVHFGLEYGITNWLMAGIGRGTYEKTFDGFIKLSPLRQSKGARNMPVSVSLFASTAVAGVKWANPERTNYFTSRLSYVYQVLVARKFNQRFSAQITPSMVHKNLVPTELDPNDIFALGLGGRVKITNRISFNAEYYYVFKPNDYLSDPVYNPLSFGFDIETGGHVFQLIFTNSLAMIEKGFITETTGQWLKGDIHFGFNISRVFMLGGN
jgi:hypothetical protein